jgi:hypothetical protein
MARGGAEEADRVNSAVAVDPIDQSEESLEVTETTSVSVSPTATPRERLEAAGGVIEENTDGQPTGVNLSGAEISAELMQAVSELGEIQWLDLRGTDLSDEHLSVLDQLPHLQLLALSDTDVTDEGLKSVQGLQELRFLSLDRTRISDVGLMRLAGLRRLEGISLQGTSVSQAGATSFKTETPQCNVILDESAPEQSPVSAPLEIPETSPGEPTSSIPHQVPQRNRPASQLSQLPVRAVADVHETREELSSLLQQKLLDPEVLEALGQHLLAQGNNHQSVRAFGAVLTHEPDNLRAHFGLAVARARLGDFEGALPHFARVVGETTALYNLGVIAFELRQIDKSEQFFRQALQRELNFTDAQQWLAYLQRQKPVTPTAHMPEPADEQGLVNLLITEFGRAGSLPARPQGGAAIQIVPAVKSPSAGGQ